MDLISDEDVPAHPSAPESPALYRSATETPAFELKFLLNAEEACEVERRFRLQMGPDPYACPALGAYHVTSVYFDTLQLDVYRRSKKYRRRKYRVRRYGTTETAFLERKSRKDERVRKRRTALPLAELAVLSNGMPADWPGAWFARQLARRALRPICRVSYERIALVGTCHAGPIRVTFDRSACGSAAHDPLPESVPDGKRLMNGEVIVEFKFLASLPGIFKDVIEELRLCPRPVSKYRRCVEALGLATENRNA